MTECTGVTKLLKVQEQMLRAQWMANIRDREMEIVNLDAIYA